VGNLIAVPGDVQLHDLNSGIGIGFNVAVPGLCVYFQVRLLSAAQTGIDVNQLASKSVSAGDEVKVLLGFVGQGGVVVEFDTLSLQVQFNGLNSRSGLNIKASFHCRTVDPQMRGTRSADLRINGSQRSVIAVSAGVEGNKAIVVVDN